MDHLYHSLHNLGAVVLHHGCGNNRNTQLWKHELHELLTGKQHLALTVFYNNNELSLKAALQNGFILILAMGKLRHKEVKWLVHSTSMAASELQLRTLIPSSVLSSVNYTAFTGLAANTYLYTQRAQKISQSSCFPKSCKQTST